jgi:intracellular multiplication protein IcmL
MSPELDNLTTGKNNFYRDGYRRLMRIILIASLVAVTLLLVLSYLIFTQPKAKYYASTTTGRVIPIESLSSPVVTSTFIRQWASLAVRSSFNLDFVHYQTQLSKSSFYFVPSGWSAFKTALQASGVLKTLVQKKLFASAFVNGTPRIIDRYISHGQFTWKVQLPLLVTYTSASAKTTRQLYVALTIKRVPELTFPKGIAITGFAAR